MRGVNKILLFFLIMSSMLQARTPEEAARIASQFIGQAHVGSPTLRIQRAAAATNIAAPVDLVYTQYQIDETTPAVYVFNSQDREGFVLVAAEDNARTILGYSDTGYFDQEDIPENMQFWLQMYADELAAYPHPLPEGKGSILRKSIGERQEASEAYPTISPILGNTIWGQGEPFNNKCPQYNGKRTVTGCVATALSQIMYVHKYPTKGTGSHSYTTESKKLKVSADFGNTTYDWANMIPNYEGSYTTTQADAVATLMYHVGVAADMDYTVEGSGTVSSIALAAMTEYFSYDKAIRPLPKDYMKEDQILKVIAADLQVGRPVYVSGATVNREGHAFVCDGMKSDGYLHINWGWDGMANGYFALSALSPEIQGTGGSASNLAFTESVDVYTNIKPDAGGEALPLVTISQLTRTSADAISKSTKVSFSLDEFASSGIATAAGTLTYFIYNNQGEVVNKVDIGTFELATGYYYTSPITISQKLPSNLANGEYEIEIRYVDDAGTDHPILVKGLGEVRIPFSVTSNQFVFSETPEPEKELRSLTNADIVLISDSKTWIIDLFSSQFWSNTPSDKDVLIRCKIHSNSEKSVIGTYTMEAGTIDTDALYAEGYYQACYQYIPTDLHLTIIPAEDKKVTIQYYMVVNGKTKKGSYTTTPEWYSKEGDKYYYNTNYNYDLATTLPASKALQQTSTLSHSDLTEMSYFVSGIISNMRNTPEQIAQYKTARFDISDDGTINKQFHCYNTKWLNNTDFTTGKEIAVGDEVVVLGHLQNYGGTTPEIKGYVYEHTAAEVPIDYSIKNLKLTTNLDTVFFNFESEASYFHVKITKEDGTTDTEGIFDFKNAYAVLKDGDYTLWIRPMDAAKEKYVAEAVETKFTIKTPPVADYTIRNLNATVEDSIVYFDWESDAPYFHVKIIKDDQTQVVDTIIDYKPAKIALANGSYTLWIRPMDEAKEKYLAEAEETTVVVNVIDYSIKNLQVYTEGNRLNFSFESEAQYFHIKIINEQGKGIANNISGLKTFTTELENGTYTLWIRPMDEAKENYLAEAAETTFTIKNDSTSVENVAIDETNYLYDITGRLVDSRNSNDNRSFNVPNSGIYILVTGNNTNKIYIPKQ